jgi:FtsP/CotA-like multicopper oxidase with cupredoxin domain
MSVTRRVILGGGAAGLLLPAAYLASRPRSPVPEPPPDESSLVRRHAQRLRLPGEGGWMTPVRAAALTELAAAPASEVLRGHRATSMWVYRAEHEGRVLSNPLLMARPGDRVALRFRNALPQPTTIHWHGFANDGRNDGGGQLPVPPSGEQAIDWTVHGGAALNWYHPHPHALAGEQLWRGLGGMFIVEDDASDRLAAALGLRFGVTDIPLMLQDRWVKRDGTLPYLDSTMDRVLANLDPASRASYESLCTSGAAGPLLHGARGDDVLVNWTRFPFVEVPCGWVRLRLLNASNARVYRLAFEQKGLRLPFMLLGVDGALLPAPQELRESFLAPAQRLDVAIELPASRAGTLWLKTLPFNPMHNDARAALQAQIASAAATPPHLHGRRGEGAEESLLRIEAVPGSTRGNRLPQTLAGHAASPRPDAPPREFLLDQDRSGRWTINGQTFHATQDAFDVMEGSREVWTLRNAASGMPHPMHLHGFGFQVLGRAGSPPHVAALATDPQGRTAQDQGWQDTVLVWPGETVRLALDFSRPKALAQQRDRFMFHCHNLEHEDMGMMLAFSVVPGRRGLAV